MKAGLFGGTFNPVHCAHLVIAEWIRDAIGLDAIFFIPSGLPPHKTVNSDLIDSNLRYQMALLAVENNPAFKLLDYESESPQVSYSFDTVQRFRKDYTIAGKDVYFIIGEDNLRTIATWKKPVELSRICRIVVARRPSNRALKLPEEMAQPIVIETPVLDISATEIRRRIRNNQSIKYLVPEKVEQFIYEHGLYGAQNKR